MDGRAASITVTDKIPYFLEAGVSPIVVSAVTGKKDSRFPHYQLLPWGPSGLRFDVRHWFSIRFGKKTAYKIVTPCVSMALFPLVVIERLLVGLSSQWSWAWPAAWSGLRLVKQDKVDLIYSTGGAWSAHYAAWLIKIITGVKWIAEIHDPMVKPPCVVNKGSRQLRKNREQRLLQWLEGKICRDADVVWWFTEKALYYAQQRHPELANKGFSLYPGSEPPGCHAPLPNKHVYTDTLFISHFGSLANNRSLSPLLEALALFLKKTPDAVGRINLDIYGASLDNCSNETIKRLKLTTIINLHDRVEIDKVTGKSGRERIMHKMRLADVLLILHGHDEGCAEYIPSKLYDYYWTDRPILALTDRGVELDRMLKKRHAYMSYTIEQDSIVDALSQIWQDWQNKQLHKQLFQPIHVNDAVIQILDKINALTH